MQRVTDNVKERYQRKSLKNPSSAWPPFHAQSFTNLALVHQKNTQLQAKKDTTKIARMRTTGDIHKIFELTSLIKLKNIHQIFTPITSKHKKICPMHTSTEDHDQPEVGVMTLGKKCTPPKSNRIEGHSGIGKTKECICPMSILIEGHPGIGKTTLAKEMCLQWANNQLLTSYKLLLLLMLRDPDVQKITSTEQLVKYTQSTDEIQRVLSYLQDNNGVGVTLIIDGFDELSGELRHTSFFRKVIEGDVLYNAKVVVTSRPSASACLHQYVHKRIEVLGFEKSSKEQYINNALEDKPDYLCKLKVHFQQYPNIDALCYIPLNMAIIVYLCLLGSLPPTATKMYEMFIKHTICRHLKRVKNTPNDTSVAQIENLPRSVTEGLQQLQKVAFNGLVKEKIVFTLKELPVLCKHDPTCYGLLQSTQCYSAEEIGTPTQSFNFLHLGIQEYFAAKYVTTLPKDKVYTLLRESFIVTAGRKSVRLSNMWILYCGITSGQCKTLRHYLTTYGKQHAHILPSPGVISKRMIGLSKQSSSDEGIFEAETISQDILKDLANVLYLFHCFQEAQDYVLCRVLSKSFNDGVIDVIGYSLLPHQVVSLGFFLSRSHKNWRKLNLCDCGIRDHGMSILHQYLCGDKANKQKITTINLTGNNLTGASSYLIADIISHLQPHTLVLYMNKITNVKNISNAVITTSTVKVLNMRDNGLTAQEAVAVSNMMICLEELNITENELGDHGAELLSEGITNTKTLRVLDISKNNIEPPGITAIANALSNNASLEDLYMEYNEVGQNGTTAIAKTITINKTLKKLSMHDYTMDRESAIVIMEKLHCNNNITELNLSCRLQYDDTVKEEVIKINNTRNKCNVTELVVRYC